MSDQTSTVSYARQSSRRVLGIDGDGELQIVDLLRKLPECDYVAAQDAVDAMQILVNPTSLTERPDVIATADRQGRQQSLESAVTQLANSYFSLPVAQRRQQWQELSNACQDLPGLTRWLTELEPGLDVDQVPTSTDPRVAYLIDECCAIFVARGVERARRRQELESAYCDEPFAWYAALRELQLHDHFVDGIASWTESLPRAAGASKSRLEIRPEIRSQYESITSPKKRATSSGGNMTWVIVVVVMSLLRVLTQASRPSSADRDRIPRSFQMPNVQMAPTVDQSGDSSSVERNIIKFKRIESEDPSSGWIKTKPSETRRDEDREAVLRLKEFMDRQEKRNGTKNNPDNPASPYDLNSSP